MIVNSVPAFEAEIGNAGVVSEFKIKASAKSFQILSSGLYSNKIRAVIRELSTNAVDSHVAAGKKTTPFDVHLPNTLEPHFSIRDYGTGLSDEQVNKIYTTYFESTKSDSNDYVGALGLGSKSPFSYTDNFTITAIKDGIKGVYTAFINGQGVPSIAKMASEETTEPAGVEIQFSVNERWDFDKFRQEAASVFAHFALQPVVSGWEGFKAQKVNYVDKDIIPGVHTFKDYGNSYAVMGNIAYPIELPRGNDLDGLAGLLKCKLELNFEIGEIDFQASREGLSYIPSTIEAIRAKLEAVKAVLVIKLAEDLDAIDNNWERAYAIKDKSNESLWEAAVRGYLAINADKNKLINVSSSHYIQLQEPEITVDDLAKMNISIDGFSQYGDSRSVSKIRPRSNSVMVNNVYTTVESIAFAVDTVTKFLINDLTKGGLARASHHYKLRSSSKIIAYVLTPVDATKPMKLNEFYKKLQSPPVASSLNISTLPEKPRKVATERIKNMSILKLSHNYRTGWKWEPAGKASDYSDIDTHYYFAVKGLAFDSGYDVTENIDSIYSNMRNVELLAGKTIHGVRRSDIELIKTKTNWINIEDFLVKTFNTMPEAELLKYVAKDIDNEAIISYNSGLVGKVNAGSAYTKLVEQFKNVSSVSNSKLASFKKLAKLYTTAHSQLSDMAPKLYADIYYVVGLYPMLNFVNDNYISSSNITVLANYINLLDSQTVVKS